MRWTALAVLGLSACGSGTDYAAAYIANWTASGSLVSRGGTVAIEVLVPIKETGSNVIELQGFCSDTDMYADGPVADVTASGYTLRPSSCSFASVSCSANQLGFGWASGNGTLNADQLTGSVSGALTCGTLTVPYSLSFTSTAKGTYGLLRAQGGVGLSEALLRMER
jgi:hypothetical protein